MLIKGQTVRLHTETVASTDAWGVDVVSETVVDVDNVLICPTSDSDIVTEMQLYGKKSTYTLCIPKGDANDWENKKIEFFGKTWHSFGGIVEYQEELVPLEWNKKVKVELYE